METENKPIFKSKIPIKISKNIKIQKQGEEQQPEIDFTADEMVCNFENGPIAQQPYFEVVYWRQDWLFNTKVYKRYPLYLREAVRLNEDEDIWGLRRLFKLPREKSKPTKKPSPIPATVETQTEQITEHVDAQVQVLAVIDAPMKDGVRRIDKTSSPRPRVEFKGRKQANLLNIRETESQLEKPVFVLQDFTPKTLVDTHCKRSVNKKMVTDDDLVYYLKLEAAFLERTPLLHVQLKMKAQRFLKEFDMSLYTQKEKYQMVLRAVASAMLIDVEEQRVMKLESRFVEGELRHGHGKFFSKGPTRKTYLRHTLSDLGASVRNRWLKLVH